MKNCRDLMKNVSITPLLALALLCSIGCYLYYLNQSVVHVVAFERAERAAADYTTKIAALESDLIDIQYTITKQVATLRGFTTDDAKIFISRTPDSLVVRDQ